MNDILVMVLASLAAGATAALAAGPLAARVRRMDRGVARRLRAEMVEAGMDPARLPVTMLAWRFAALGVLVVVWGMMKMPPLAVVLAGVVYQAAPWWVRTRIAAYRRRINEQVAGVSRNLAGQVRVGLPLNEALASVSLESPAPIGIHLRRTSRQVAQGDDVRTALSALRDRVRVEAVTAMTIALQVAEERGGRLAEVLDRIAHCAEEIARVERKRETDTAAGRLMVALMASFPLAFLGFVYILDPAMATTMFGTLAGQSVLAVVVVIVYLSVRWAGRILSRLE